MVYRPSCETSPSREVSERSEEANRPRDLPYDALREMANSTGKVERGDGRSRLRKEAIGRSWLRKEAIRKGKEKLDTNKREFRQSQMEDEGQLQMKDKDKDKDKEQLQASAGGSRSEHDDLITEHFHEANANLDRAAWCRQVGISNEEISPNVISNNIIKHLDKTAKALELANKANEREQQRLEQQRSEQQRLVQQQLLDSRRQKQKKQYQYLVLD